MYGMVNRAIEELIIDGYGSATWESVKMVAGVDEDVFISSTGYPDEITYAPFPVADAKLLVSDTIEVPVQVNGKVRARLMAAAGSSDDQLTALALADDKVRAALAGAEPRKVIVVSGRLVNIVV